MKLFQSYEVSIKNLEDELQQKQTQLRDESRMVQHNKRVEQLNTFYKKKKIRDENLRKLEEKRLKEFNDKLKGKYRPQTEEIVPKSSKLHEKRDHVIVEERSKISDDTKTQDFYHASSDEEGDSHKKIKSPSPKQKEHKNKDLSDEDTQRKHRVVNQTEREAEDNKKNHSKKNDNIEIKLSGDNISTAPVGNNKIPELKKKTNEHSLNQDISSTQNVTII